ncbi:MAG: PAS domain S-box protein [Anaerolineales bacterium]|nr:PAS domain S-box protein [Anaerolineales bacterium]
MDVDVDIIIARDIRERNRAVQALQRERQFTDTILDTVAMWVVVIDTSGNIIHINRACELATGLSLDNVRGKSLWITFVPAESRARVSASFATWPVEPMPRSYESSFTTNDGKDRHIAWQIGAAYREDGSVAYFIGAGIDITERQELEELRIKEHVINASLLPIGILDLNGQILYANPALVRLWGYGSASEILGLDHALLFQFPDQVRSTFAHVQQKGSWTGEASCVPGWRPVCGTCRRQPGHKYGWRTTAHHFIVYRSDGDSPCAIGVGCQ